MYSELESLGPLARAVPVFGNEAERRTTFVQAHILERRELVDARSEQHAGSENPGVLVQPGDLLDGGVDSRVAYERKESK